MKYDKDLPTPSHCMADFSLIPIGTSKESFAEEISDVVSMAKNSGLEVNVHEVGTAIEGPWDQVSQFIGQAHTMLHRHGTGRIQTDLRITTRMDKEQTMHEPVERVEKLMSQSSGD
ncbi:hypothetical protein FE257_009200 [Aspergillus nanangensis]|uniref:Thiamine-binding protein domain-containing protein n=1 Tax=Aspergillus nanangensis TaxID=2582783 RepID=A0AAD4GT28_ASPNN|nr:hypothetical protein FE257_009200 [Aspergillus nanangensis]